MVPPEVAVDMESARELAEKLKAHKADILQLQTNIDETIVKLKEEHRALRKDMNDEIDRCVEARTVALQAELAIAKERIRELLEENASLRVDKRRLRESLERLKRDGDR